MRQFHGSSLYLQHKRGFSYWRRRFSKLLILSGRAMARGPSIFKKIKELCPPSCVSWAFDLNRMTYRDRSRFGESYIRKKVNDRPIALVSLINNSTTQSILCSVSHG